MNYKVTIKIDDSPFASFLQLVKFSSKFLGSFTDITDLFSGSLFLHAKVSSFSADAGVVRILLYPSDRLLEYVSARWTGDFLEDVIDFVHPSSLSNFQTVKKT